jgi:RNA polymerase sigma-70 factor (ECF subfamily)
VGGDPAGAVGATDLLARLPADRRAAFVLTQLVGLSYEEAAAVERVPVGTIRSRVARARSDLVAQLAAAEA